MNHEASKAVWVCAIVLLAILCVEVVGAGLSLMQARQLREELAQLKESVEQLDGSLEENLSEISALCASVNETQRRIQAFFEGDNPLAKWLPE